MKRLKFQFYVSIFLFLLLIAGGWLLVECYFQSMKGSRLYRLKGKAGTRAMRFAMQYNEYDALILGSSMSTNFFCSDFDRSFHTKSLKLAESGYSLPMAMETASFALMQKKESLKYILLDLTCTHFLPLVPRDIVDAGKSASLESLQDYVSFDTIRYALGFFLGDEHRAVSRDDYGNWYQEDLKKIPVREFAAEIRKGPGPREQAYQFSRENTLLAKKILEQDVIPLVRHYPSCQFIFFFPPYSMLSYEFMDRESMLDYKRMVMALLLEEPNVKLFDFQNAVQIASCLDNYKDYTHYMQHINRWIIEQIAENNFLVTRENQEQMLREFHRTLETYDYEKDRFALKKMAAEQQ